ncbi:MAG TPA: hypothetical protein DEP87_03345 [Candidatus Pacebacteria bacterium]|nr:hypothetical protein [Candidatus Paceibacterota bacterium]
MTKKFITIPLGMVIFLAAMTAAYFLILIPLFSSFPLPHGGAEGEAVTYVTASGGGGVVVAESNGIWIKIEASRSGGENCDWKVKWSDGDQIGSNWFYPCSQQGYEELVRKLYELEKFKKEFFDALMRVKVF